LIVATDATALVKQLRSTGTATVGEFEIALDDLVITEVPKSGWMVSSHDGESVALDLALSPALIASGNVREVIRMIQERRKSDGFEISDRIHVQWNAPSDLAKTITAHIQHISDEVLALSMVEDAGVPTLESELGVNIALSKAYSTLENYLDCALQ
jgi:isoleucyl-tRNA synthetase